MIDDDAQIGMAIDQAAQGAEVRRSDKRVESQTVRGDGIVEYRSHRTHKGAAVGDFRATYNPTGNVYYSHQGTLENFLTERYCLYTVDRANRLMRCDIHHPPWLLQPGTADIRGNTLTDAAGIRLPAMAPILHFSKRQDTVNWPLVRLASRA